MLIDTDLLTADHIPQLIEILEENEVESDSEARRTVLKAASTQLREELVARVGTECATLLLEDTK